MYVCLIIDATINQDKTLIIINTSKIFSRHYFKNNPILKYLFNRLAPIYDMVTSDDKSYLKASLLLENMKKTLVDINDIRNEPWVLKIQSKISIL